MSYKVYRLSFIFISPLYNRMAPPIVGQLVAYIIGFAFVSLLIAGIILLIRSATCTTSNAENVYEHFDETDDYLANLQKHTKLVRQAMATLQNDMDILDEDTDDTCDIMKSVEDTFISNKSAPSDESEFELSREEQQKRIDRRKVNAKKSFQEKKNVFAASTGKLPLLECFASVDAVAQAQEELADAVNELTTLLDSAEMKLAITKGQKTWLSLLFTAPYLKKAVDMSTSKPTENFASMKDRDLLSQAITLIGKANTIHASFKPLRDQIVAQKAVVRSLNTKAGDLQQGNISQSDVSAGVKHATSA
jgi:hypothetical protein